MKIAVLGTGIMGGPMAANLARAGHDVTVWNRTRAKAEAVEGARVAGSPKEAVAAVEAVVTMLADGDAVEETMRDALPALPREAVWIQTSTVGVDATERLQALAREHGVAFVDAPVLGTKKPAEDGTLVVLASGPDEVRERAQPVFDAVGGRTMWLGAAGAGSRLKLVANNWVLTLVEGIAETFALAGALGLDGNLFLDAIRGGGVDVAYAHLKGAQILARDFPASFPLALAEKDVRLVLEAAEAHGLRMALTETVRAQFRRAIELGHADEDMASTFYATAN
jgi:3-hydroxyisobutyrate dehydrogenase